MPFDFSFDKDLVANLVTYKDWFAIDPALFAQIHSKLGPDSLIEIGGTKIFGSIPDCYIIRDNDSVKVPINVLH